ncbi:MAG TPA: trigger factor [Actinomycetota bacterium]|nr:trigger factor [Actinomycetota bacterium]
MESTLEETAKHRVRLKVEVPPEEFGRDLDAAYRRIAEQVRIPGFRKGKVPRKVIDAKVGRDAVLEEFLSDAVPAYYERALREHELAPIASPDISLEQVEEGKPLVFTAEVEVRPRLRLEGYKGIRVERPRVEVSEAEVDEMVDRLRERFAELEVVARPARRGDYVVADIRATVHEEEVPEATRPGYLYEVGRGEFGPRLDEELEGKRAGDILRFNQVLPEGFGGRTGQEVSFTVLLKEVKAKRLPAADDEFARTASEFDTLKELRADLREKLRAAKEREADRAVRDRVLQALVERVDVELPDRLVDEETERRVEAARERAARMGLTIGEVLSAQGWDELRFRADARAHAIRAIKADLVLEAVARQEGIEVSAEELGREIAGIAASLGRDPKEVAATLDRSGQIVTLAGDIIRSKALDLLVEHAEITSEGEAPVRTPAAAEDDAAPQGTPSEAEP